MTKEKMSNKGFGIENQVGWNLWVQASKIHSHKLLGIHGRGVNGTFFLWCKIFTA